MNSIKTTTAAIVEIIGPAVNPKAIKEAETILDIIADITDFPQNPTI